MAEFPTLGKQCAKQECQQLDFLPVRCTHCAKDFCKLHYQPDDHDCQNKPDIQANPGAGSGFTTYPCSLDSCDTSELTEMQCFACKKHFCLKHRHQADHGCTAYEAPEEVMPKTRELVQSLTKQQSEAKPARTAKSAKAQKLAAKVTLMKLKMKSSGSQSVPTEERFYFRVLLPIGGANSECPVFVSSKWSMGKVLDAVATVCKVENKNNVAGEKRLQLFRHQDGQSICCDPSQPLSQLAGAEEVFNGDTVILEYVEDGVGSVDASKYKIKK